MTTKHPAQEKKKYLKLFSALNGENLLNLIAAIECIQKTFVLTKVGSLPFFPVDPFVLVNISTYFLSHDFTEQDMNIAEV